MWDFGRNPERSGYVIFNKRLGAALPDALMGRGWKVGRSCRSNRLGPSL